MRIPHFVVRPRLIIRPRFLSLALTFVVALDSTAYATKGPGIINVSDVEGLYDAVNNSGNAGATIVLAPGHYVLTARIPAGALRPNGGRLELQPGMSLSGAPGHPENVVIDASGPLGPSFASPQGNTGVIRIGRSHESIEWLTVSGVAGAAACIETDLVDETTATLRIAHTILTGGNRGLDVRNFGPASAGRMITIDLDDNELTGNISGNGQGVRFVNMNGANGAAISASLHGNYSHANLIGCLVANLAASGASIDIDSQGDRFDSNLGGCVLFGGITTTPTTVANDNTVTFVAHAGEVVGNVGVLAPDGDTGGLVVVGGLGAVPGAASRNVVHVSVWGTKFDGNQNTDISAWGARTVASAPAGTDNAVAIELHGVSQEAVTLVTQSKPDEAAGTNSAVIVE